jgi:hypothetical protein
MVWSCKRVSRRMRSQGRAAISRRKPRRVLSCSSCWRTEASRRRVCRKQAAAMGLALGGRPAPGPGW